MGIIVEAKDPVLVATGPYVVQAVDDLNRSDKTVIEMTTELKKRRYNRGAVKEGFALHFDKTRSCVGIHMPHVDLSERASGMSTPDDVLNEGRKLEVVVLGAAGVDEAHPLAGEGESAPAGATWAIDLARVYSPQLAEAIRQHQETTVLSDQLQKAIEDRAMKRRLLEDRLVYLRKLVRDVYGSRSHEYHQLRQSRSQSETTEVEPRPEPTAAEPAPMAAAA